MNNTVKTILWCLLGLILLVAAGYFIMLIM